MASTAPPGDIRVVSDGVDPVSPVTTSLAGLGLNVPPSASDPAPKPVSAPEPVPSGMSMPPPTPTMTRETPVASATSPLPDGVLSPASSAALPSPPTSPTPTGNVSEDRAAYEAFVRYLETTLLAPLPDENGPVDPSAPSTKLPRRAILAFVLHHGVPERPRLRSIMWKLILGYLPWDRALWKESFARARASYADFVSELTVNPYDDDAADASTAAPAPAPAAAAVAPTKPVRSVQRKAITIGDDPLSGLTAAVKAADSAAAAAEAGETGPVSVTAAAAAAGKGKGGKSAEWTQYFADEEIRSEIDKDVNRTYSSLHFFQLPAHPDDKDAVQRRIAREAAVEAASLRAIEAARANRARGGPAAPAAPAGGLFSDDVSNSPAMADALYNKSRRARRGSGVVEVTASEGKGPICHHDLLRRLLFLYAKLNPGVRYVQGMNEILAPLYYVFASDPDPFSRTLGPSAAEAAAGRGRTFSDAEADAFFCFTNVMAEIRDRFIKSLDHSETGILAVVEQLSQRVRKVDPVLWQHMSDKDVDPRFYSFRWLTLLVSQEFELPDVLRLWDSFFADEDRFSFHLTFCCAMLVNVRDTVLAGEFSDILHVLQEYPETDLRRLLAIAHDLRTCLARGVRSRYTGLTPTETIVKAAQESRFTQFIKASLTSFSSGSSSNN